MKPALTFTLLSVICLSASAQIEYQPGYFIREDGSKTACLIRNYGWVNNPASLVYKTSASSSPVTLELSSGITEFKAGSARYVRFSIDVDTSAQELTDSSMPRGPEFRHETAFLRLLVEGRASLYLYSNRSVVRFYFNLSGATIQPLICKKYMWQGGAVPTNSGYVAELRDNLVCSAEDFPDPSLVAYEEGSLARYFVAYDKCVHAPYTDYRKTKGKTGVHLAVRPGLDLTNLTLDDQSQPRQRVTYSYGKAVSFRIGVEAEFMLRSEKKHWAIVAEPAYRSYSTSQPVGAPGLHASYKAAELNAGVRYYIFTGGPSVFYLTPTAFGDFPLNSTIQDDQLLFPVHTHFGGALSAGYLFAGRFGAALRYDIPFNILHAYGYTYGHLTTASLVLSYRLL